MPHEMMSPRSAYKRYGDIRLSEYFALIDPLGIGREGLLDKSQKDIVWEHLRLRGSITQLGAAMLYDVWRLSEDISGLRKELLKEGKYHIYTERHPTKRAGRYGEYHLIEGSEPPKQPKKKKTKRIKRLDK